MKKRLISLLLSLMLILTSMMPAFGVLATYDAKQVYISAESDSNINIKGDDDVPPEYDYNGNLYIYADSHNIERDYSQKASVYVTNYSEKTIEYYLVSKNPYDDLYMNFVRSGSVASPLVIQAGESQKIELDIFAQNAKKSEYEIPVYAVIVNGEETIEDAKCTLNLYCDDIYFNFSVREIAVNESTLSKTLKLTNNGDALTDVTVSLEGQIADYVMLNPIVANHQMKRYDSIEIKASPDLTKMKSNNASLIKGHLVISSAGKSQKFELIFDTKGQEITSTTMGQLALKQSGNSFYDIAFVKGTDKSENASTESNFIYKKSAEYLYANDKSLDMSVAITGKKDDVSVVENKFYFNGNNSYSIEVYDKMDSNEFDEFILKMRMSDILDYKEVLLDFDYNIDEDSDYIVSYKIDVNDGLSKTADDSLNNLFDLVYATKQSNSSEFLRNPETSDSEKLEYCSYYLSDFILNSKSEREQKENVFIDSLIKNATFSDVVEYYTENEGIGYEVTVDLKNEETLPFKFYCMYECNADIDYSLIYEVTQENSKKCYISRGMNFFEKDGLYYLCSIMYKEQDDGSFVKIMTGMSFFEKITTYVDMPTYEDNIVTDIAKGVVNVIDSNAAEYLDLVDTINSYNEAFNDFNHDVNHYGYIQHMIKQAKEFDNTAEGRNKLSQVEASYNLAKLCNDAFDAANSAQKLAEASIDSIYTGGNTAADITKQAAKVAMSSTIRDMKSQASLINDMMLREAYEQLLEYFEYLENQKEKYIDKYGKDKGTAMFLQEYGSQCTNAGKITNNFYANETPKNTEKAEKNIPVSDVKISQSNLNLSLENTYFLDVTVKPSNATNKNVIWTSSNPDVVEVDENGMIIAKKGGTATITVTSNDGKKSSTCEVEVKDNGNIAKFSPSVITMPEGVLQTTNIKVKVDDIENFEIQNVIYESSDPRVAIVDDNGVINSKKSGETTITASFETNRGPMQCTVAVIITKAVTDVYMGNINDTWNASIGETQTNTPTVYPEGSNQTVTWSSSDESVATVDQNGTITAVGEGTATITVTTVEGNFKDTMTVEVSAAQPMAFALRSAAPQATETNKGVGLFVTSRMYGGDGVNRWYGDSSTDYVDIADTTYTYTLNGKKVGTSHNSGVTDLSIVEIPVEHLRFGANNTLVCDYDTNPGHYFVNTDTQITITYPADTPISYIGTPADLQDVRALPDYAIYSENIFGNGKNVVIGNEIEVSFNVYNRGSMGGWFDIVVTDKNGTIYEEENHYLDAFAGDVISFKWTPEYTSEDLTVTLTNKSVGIDERSSENNQATRTFVARERTKPVIKSITPDYLVEGNGTLVATLSSYEDVTDVKFYIDDACCEGEVKSSNINGDKRYWINCSNMAEGTYNIKVVVTYINGKDTTDTVEKTVSLSVLDKDWNKYKFNIDESATGMRCYIFDIDNNYYYSTYDFSRMGTECTLTITKDIFDNLANYYLCIRSNEGFMFKNMADIGEGFIFDECKTLTFVEDENLQVSNISLVKFDDNYIGTWMSDSNMYLTPGKYVFDVGFYYYNEYRSAEIEVDLSDDNVVVDLSEYVTKYKFKFADEIQGDVNSALWYRNKYDDSWYSLDLIQVVEEDIFVLMPYVDDEYELEYADEMFVSITTDDISFIHDIDLSDDISTDIISISKSKLQKYKMSANDDSSDFRMREVLVENDKLSVILYAETIYLTPGEYDITVTYKDAEVTEPIMMTMSARTVIDEVQSRDLQNKKLLVKWADAYQGTNAYIYALGENGTGTGYNDVTSGKEIVIADDVYNIKTNLVRNESRFTISSYIDTYSDADVTIGNKFVGAITNTFATYKPSSNVTLYIDDLYDENGNELIEFISNSYEDSLYGNVILTNINDENEKYCIPVSLDNVNSVDIELPESTGEFTVKLEVYTVSDLILPELPEEPVEPEVPVVESIQLNAYDITLNCCGTYQLIADQLPEEAEDCKLVWYSSDERIATVDENGLVTAGKNVKGCATITAMTEDGLIKAECKVTVKFTFVQWLIWFFTFGCIRDFISKLVG